MGVGPTNNSIFSIEGNTNMKGWSYQSYYHGPKGPTNPHPKSTPL